VSDVQYTDERECRYLLTTVGDLGVMVPKEVDVRLEVVSRPHLDGEEVVNTPLGFLESGILSEEGLNNLREVVKKRGVRE